MARPTTPVLGIRPGESLDQIRKRSFALVEQLHAADPARFAWARENPTLPIFTSTPAKRSGPAFAVGDRVRDDTGRPCTIEEVLDGPHLEVVFTDGKGGSHKWATTDTDEWKTGDVVEDFQGRPGEVGEKRSGPHYAVAFTDGDEPDGWAYLSEPELVADDNPKPDDKPAGASRPRSAARLHRRVTVGTRLRYAPPGNHRGIVGTVTAHRPGSFSVDVVLSDGQKKFFHLPWCKVLK